MTLLLPENSCHFAKKLQWNWYLFYGQTQMTTLNESQTEWTVAVTLQIKTEDRRKSWMGMTPLVCGSKIEFLCTFFLIKILSRCEMEMQSRPFSRSYCLLVLSFNMLSLNYHHTCNQLCSCCTQVPRSSFSIIQNFYSRVDPLHRDGPWSIITWKFHVSFQ